MNFTKIRKQDEDHVFIVTSVVILAIAAINFIPWFLYFVKAHALYTFYAILLLPLPAMVSDSVAQGNAASGVISGLMNNDVTPTINFILKCTDGFRLLWNAIVNVIRTMIKAIMINFLPINRNTIFTIIKNVFFIATQFATILVTMIIDLLDTLVDVFLGKGINFTFIEAFIKFIIGTLVDVIDNPPCFHPLDMLPGIFIHCIYDPLNATDVNNAGFIGFMESLVIIICRKGTLQSDFINDILLPCTGLDAFFIFKDIYFEIAGNVTNIFNDQSARLQADIARIEHLAQEVVELAPRIVAYIIRKICGGISFFCKIIGNIGIPGAKLQTRYYDKKIDSLYGDSVPSSIAGVCVYRSSESGEFLGCFYSEPSMAGFRDDKGRPFNFTEAYNIINQVQVGMNTTYLSFFKTFDQLQAIQDALIYNTDLTNNHILTNIQNIKNLNTTVPSSNSSSYILQNSFYGNALPNPPHHQQARQERALKNSKVYQQARFAQKGSIVEHNYEQTKSLFKESLATYNESASAFNVMLIAASHGIKALSVGLTAIIKHREIDSVTNFTMQGLNDIGFDFSEVMNALDNHTMTYHPGMHEQTFNIDVTLNGVLASLVFNGIQHVSSLFVAIIGLLVGILGFALTTIGMLGSLINTTTGTQSHYDVGFNLFFTPLANLNYQHAYSVVDPADTAATVELVMTRIPLILEASVLEVVRLGGLCNIPVPLGPLTCPIDIPMNINDGGYVGDLTIDYFVNITMCNQDAYCVPDNPDTFNGGVCIDYAVNCWGTIPFVQIPNIEATISPNTQLCTYNGTRPNEHLSWYDYAPNWLIYTYRDGFKFLLRIGVRGYSLPFLLIPACYLASKICICVKFIFVIIMYLTIAQYFLGIFKFLPDLCPWNNRVCKSFNNYISFPNGAPSDDDYYCFFVGIPVFYLGYMQTSFYVQVFLLLLATGIYISIIIDIYLVIKFIILLIYHLIRGGKNHIPKYIKLKKL